MSEAAATTTTSSMIPAPDGARRDRSRARSILQSLGILTLAAGLVWLAVTERGRDSVGAAMMAAVSLATPQPLSLDDIELHPSALDLGEAQCGTTATGTVKIINKGARAFTIGGISSTCGCTVAEKPQGPIAPGEQAEFQVRMSVGERPGVSSTKTLTLRIDGLREGLKLPVTTRAVEFVRLSARTIDPHTAPEATLAVESTDGRRFSIESVTPAVFESPGDTARTRHEMRFSKAKWLEAGSPRQVQIRTRHPEAPVVTVRLSATHATSRAGRAGTESVAAAAPAPSAIRDRVIDLQCHPQRLAFGTIEADAGFSESREITLKGVVSSDADLSVEVGLEGISAEVVNIQPAAEEGVVVTVRLVVADDHRLALAGRRFALPITLTADGRSGQLTGYLACGSLSSSE